MKKFAFSLLGAFFLCAISSCTEKDVFLNPLSEDSDSTDQALSVQISQPYISKIDSACSLAFILNGADKIATTVSTEFRSVDFSDDYKSGISYSVLGSSKTTKGINDKKVLSKTNDCITVDGIGDVRYLLIPEENATIKSNILYSNSSTLSDIDVRINGNYVPKYSTEDKKIYIDYKSKKAGCFVINLDATAGEEKLAKKVLVLIYPKKCNSPASAFVVVNNTWVEGKGRKIEFAFMGNDENVDEYTLGIVNKNKYIESKGTTGKLLEYYTKLNGLFTISLFAKNRITKKYEDLQTSFSFILENIEPLLKYSSTYKKTTNKEIQTGDTLFVDLSTSYDKDGSIVKYAINFGDGYGVVEQASPLFNWNYAEAGTYNVCMSVWDDEGSVNDSFPIKVIGEKKAKAYFEIESKSYFTGDTVYLDATKSTPSRFANITSYKWDVCWDKNVNGFDDDEWIEIATGKIKNHIVNWVNNSKIRLTIEDSKGDKSSHEVLFNVSNRLPSISRETKELDNFVSYSGKFRYFISSDLPPLLGESNNTDRYSLEYNYFPQNYNNYLKFTDSFSIKFEQASAKPILVRLIDRYSKDIVRDIINLDVKELGLKLSTNADNSQSAPFLQYMGASSVVDDLNKFREYTNNSSFPIEISSDCKKIVSLSVASCSYQIGTSESAYYYGNKKNVPSYEFKDGEGLFKKVNYNFDYSRAYAKNNKVVIKAVYSSGSVQYAELPFSVTDGKFTDKVSSLISIVNTDGKDKRSLKLNAYSNYLRLSDVKIAYVENFDVNDVCNFRIKAKAFKFNGGEKTYLDSFRIAFNVGENKSLVSNTLLKELLFKYGRNYYWDISLEWQSKKWDSNQWIMATKLYDSYDLPIFFEECLYPNKVENITSEVIATRLDKKSAIHRSYKNYDYKTKFSESTFWIKHRFLSVDDLKKHLVIYQTSGCFRMGATLVDAFYDEEGYATLKFKLPATVLPPYNPTIPGGYYHDETKAIYEAYCIAEDKFRFYQNGSTQRNNFFFKPFLKEYEQSLINLYEDGEDPPYEDGIYYPSELIPAIGVDYKKDWKHEQDMFYLNIVTLNTFFWGQFFASVDKMYEELAKLGLSNSSFCVDNMWEIKNEK